MLTPIRVLLVDDHRVLSESLGAMINNEPDMQTVGMACNASDAIQEIERNHPHIVVMDIDMPGLSSFEAARTVQDRWPSIKTIFLSGWTNDYYVAQALDMQAGGYLVKGDPPRAVVEAIRKVAAGGTYYSPRVSERIVIDRNTAVINSTATMSRSRVSLLTRREIEFLRYVAKGLSKKEIATISSVSIKTVDGHITNLMNKLDIHDRVELARFAIREGFIGA